MGQLAMNRKEWKEFCKLDKGKAHYWYNKARKKLLSKEFESDPRTDKDAKVIHHLRDTEEQRKYNDEHYEMFGYVVDENGNEQFNYGDYVVFWTQDHHREYHHVSEETRKKLSESLKGIPRTDAWRQHASESNKGKHNYTEEQKLQISNSVKEYYMQEGSREKTSKTTKEAMQRSEVRQHLIDGCKKRPPISKEARQKAAEANKGKTHSAETKQLLSEKKKAFYENLHRQQAISFNFNTELESLIGLISNSLCVSHDVVRKLVSEFMLVNNLSDIYNARDIVYIFNALYEPTSKYVTWNKFQSIFFKLRRLVIRRIKCEQLQ